MKQHAAALPFTGPQVGPMPTPRGLLRLLIVTVYLSFAKIIGVSLKDWLKKKQNASTKGAT